MVNVSCCDSVWLCYCSKKSGRKSNDKEVQNFKEVMICFLHFMSFLKILLENIVANLFLVVYTLLN